MFQHYLYFFVYISFKVKYTSRVTKLKNDLFYNKRQIKKGYFAKEIDPPKVLFQRKSPF
jgi:hypothetical protein